MERAQAVLIDAVLRIEPGLALRVEEIGDDADHPRGVEHVHSRLAVLGRDRTAVCCFDVVAPPMRSGS